MNCHLARNRILAVEEPADLPDELSAHIRECAACKAWHGKFNAVDRALPQLPVHESDGLSLVAVLKKVRATPTLKKTAQPQAAIAPMRLNLADDLPKKKRSFGRMAAKFWPAGLVAATLLIGTLAWLTLRGDRAPMKVPSPADPLLDSLVRLNVDLAKTQTAAERVVVLAKVADELNDEMRGIARADATGENMQALEEMYRRVVVKGLVAQAKLIDRKDREVLLGKIADGLAQAGDKAEKMAAESPEHSAASLREAAVTARDATKRLRVLIREAYS